MSNCCPDLLHNLKPYIKLSLLLPQQKLLFLPLLYCNSFLGVINLASGFSGKIGVEAQLHYN